MPDDEPPDDAGDPVALEAKQRRVRKKLRLGGDFWRMVFADPVGRAEMWRLLETTHAFETRFECGPNGFPQPEATWFRAGEQAFGLALYHAWMAMDPGGVQTMLIEHDPRFAALKSSK